MTKYETFMMEKIKDKLRSLMSEKDFDAFMEHVYSDIGKFVGDSGDSDYVSAKAMHKAMNKMSNKLHSLMSDSDFLDFNTAIARQAFRMEIEDMEDGEFKDYLLRDFEKITATVGC